ncbi:MAG: sulfotransferase, partial [Spirochaetaceae bacterium]|nr:sulfotransferase [Spirochaetaceae bacterium]
MRIPFNWAHLFRQIFRSVFGTRGTHRRFTAHRAGALTIFWIIFIPHQIVTRICLLLDNLFFPRWKRTPVNRPLFITGLFRSGTTFLHRLMAGDENTFSAFKTWEIYLAPSILQRKILKAWKRLDQLIGSPAMKWLLRYNSRSLGEIQFHQVGLWKEEEDEGLLLFLWDSLFTWFFFPDTAGIRDYQFADREMSPRRQKRKLAFYKTCIQRHLYCHPNASVYLSKNPAFTPKLASLKEEFPDARIVYMIRNPARVLVSQAAWFSVCWNYFASPIEPYPFRDELFEMTRHWYSYPLELLDSWKSSDHLIVEYRNLIASPVETITGLYTH